jgi:hypothetical protein
MQRLALLVALMLAPPPAAGQSIVSPEAYEALAEGRTLHYTLEGQPFGAEQYFPGRRSLWRFAAGDCVAGIWHAEGPRICFVYEDDPQPQCWSFLHSGDRLRAKLLTEPRSGGPPLVLELSHVDDAPLDCPGPDVGM